MSDPTTQPAMEGGAELDARVAVEVMGVPLSDGRECRRCGGRGEYSQRRLSTSRRGTMQPCPTCRGTTVVDRVTPKPYSRDISAAWSVIEKLIDRDPVIRRDGNLWMVIMDASNDPADTVTQWPDHRTYITSRRRVDAHDASLCRAICECSLSALAAVKGEGKEPCPVCGSTTHDFNGHTPNHD